MLYHFEVSLISTVGIEQTTENILIDMALTWIIFLIASVSQPIGLAAIPDIGKRTYARIRTIELTDP